MPDGPPVCLACGKSGPPPALTCDGGTPGGTRRDHFIGTDHDLACSSCGRLASACAVRPCQVMRAESYEPGWDDEDEETPDA